MAKLGSYNEGVLSTPVQYLLSCAEVAALSIGLPESAEYLVEVVVI